MKKLHLQEGFKNDKLKFFQQQAFDNNKLLRKWATILTGFVCVYEVAKIQNILPEDLAVSESKTNYLCTVLYITALTLYYFSIFKFSGKISSKAYFVRLILMVIAGVALASALGLTLYDVKSDRAEHNSAEKWLFSSVLDLEFVWMTLLLDILAPIWYLKFLVPASYWTVLIVVCYQNNFEHKGIIMLFIFLSIFFTVGYWGMKAFYDWKVFTNRLNIEAWDDVHQYILDKVPDAIAVINEKANVIYSNSTFKALCKDNLDDLSKTLTHCKKLRSNPLMESNLQKRDKKSFDNDYVDETSVFLTFSEILHNEILPMIKEQHCFENYLTFSAQMNKIQGNENISLTYEIRIRQLLEYNKAIVILADTTQRDLAISLETANKYKDKLLATVSHDLRAPINGSISLIESSLEHEAVPEFIKEQFLIPAQRSCMFLLHLANDILDFSQINVQKLRMNFEMGSLVETIKSCYQLLEMQASKKKIDFKLELADDLPDMFTTDHNRLSQVIINLLTNAIKFTFSGVVTLSAHVVSDLILIKVTDTGIGIKDQDKEKLFQEFTRIEYDKQGINTRGVGIGLVISNKLAKKLGPRRKPNGINFSSVYGQGSIFMFMLEDKRKADDDKLRESWFTHDKSGVNLSISALTFREEDFLFQKIDEGLVPGRTALRYQSRTPSNLGSKPQLLSNSLITQPLSPNISNKKQFRGRVLVVDDDAINIIAFENIMKKYGIIVISVYNGQEAIKKVLQNKGAEEPIFEDPERMLETPKIRLLSADPHYQIIFMDYEMPIMNGFEATKALTALMENKEINSIPIIGCTGHQDQQAQEQGIASGMVDVITKPPVKEKLVEILEKHLTSPYPSEVSGFVLR